MPARSSRRARRFHGGCFTGGSPDGTSGSALIEESGGDVIVVTVAFRLGVFGHLASDGLKARATRGPPGNAPGSAGNWGIQDQRESLRWVRRNIAAFGAPARAAGPRQPSLCVETCLLCRAGMRPPCARACLCW